MSNWYEVSVVAESFEQQLDAALTDYGPIPSDEQAQARLSQVKYALRGLAEYASSKAIPPTPQLVVESTPPTVTGVAKASEIKSVFRILANVASVTNEVFVSRSRAASLVAARRAISWMLYDGVWFTVPPSFPQVAKAVGLNCHTNIMALRNSADQAAPLVRRMYDECERRGIKTHPRPSWARKEQAA
jgi:chromosomal replication initiation ATPase DnaA